MTLKLADRSISRPVGVAEDVFVKVGTLHFLADFIVIDIDADPRVLLILGISFLKTGRALIDVFEDDPTSSEVDQSYLDSEGEILLLEAFLNDDPSLPPLNQGNYLPEVCKELKICEAKYDNSSIDEPPEAELKDLPPHLEYAFLEGDDKLPVIIAKDLSVEEKTALITVYALVSTHTVSKELWERIQMLMQATSLTKQERECKLYDEFDNFAYRKGETLRDFYQRFSLLLNDMNMYNMKLEQFLASQAPSSLHLSISCPPNDIQSFVNHNVYIASSSIPHMEYAPTVHQQTEFSSPETGLVVLVFQKGDDPIDAINHMMSFLTAVVTSRYLVEARDGWATGGIMLLGSKPEPEEGAVFISMN
nr:reverse transcriptase domain-containing protein [Tanacetum cinerariifolium]